VINFMTSNTLSQPMASIEQALRQAITHHQSNQLQDAERLYRAILQIQPHHPDANHNLGALAVQIKKPGAALPHFKAALEAKPKQAQYWLSYIDALIQAEQLDTAGEILAQARQHALQEQALDNLAARLKEVAGQAKTKFDQPGQHNERLEQGPSSEEVNALVELFSEERYTEAVLIAESLTKRFPLHGFGWKALGSLFKQLEQNEDALASMQKAAALSPNDAEAHFNLANILKYLERLNEAEASYRRALELNARDADTHYNLGNLLKELGRLNEAEICYRNTLDIKPDFAEAYNNLGSILNELDQLDQAEADYRRAIEINPYFAEAYCNLGSLLQKRERPDEAEACYRQVLAFKPADEDDETIFRRALAIKPNFVTAHYNLGVTLMNLGRLDEAEASYRKALELKPDYAEAHFNLGSTLQELKRLDEAEASYRQALLIKPDFAEAQYNLAITLHELERLDEAEASYRHALEIKPDYAQALCNLAGTLHELERSEEAEISCRQALELKPDFVEAYFNLGIALHAQDRFDEAEASYRRAIEIKPDYADAYCNLGITLHKLERLDEAEACYRHVIAIKPDYAEAYLNLGGFLLEQERLEEAEANCRQALAIKPDYAEAHCNLGVLLHRTHRLNEAEASFRQALEIKPDYAGAYGYLGSTLKESGQLEAAVASYKRALEISPDSTGTHSNLLFLYSFDSWIEPDEYLAQARNWEQTCLSDEERQQAGNRTFQRSPSVGRRLRVGYVSGDFRHHAVSYFIEQLFAHHDPGRIVLFAYSTQSKTDVVTERLQTHIEHWVPLTGLTASEIQARIEADNIDILIDLSGHTAHNRLDIFARRAAPVQAHYLGYFASTGLTEMDYWIGDELITPVEMDSHFSEQTWRLPRVWVSYKTVNDAPEPDWHPANDGSVWVGSFNNLGKLTPQTLALWAKVLHALPEGKLLLKNRGLADSHNCRRIVEAMAELGISEDRLDLQPDSEWIDYMAYYNRLDIALDPIGGHSGGTITCDALWMGVPVIHELGDRTTSRFTASLVNAIGHPEWIAQSETDYIDKVVALARDLEQRKALRRTQRQRMANSPLCDARGLAESLENAYFAMFERWMAQQNES